MGPVDITWLRALKIWWSYSWRAFVLMLLVMVPLEIVMFSYMMHHFPQRGAASPADAMRMAGTMAAVWPIFMAALIALQAQAMRWMLNKARWSDFRVAVLPRD
jgi:zona occludens toxin (predicted ATPase)